MPLTAGRNGSVPGSAQNPHIAALGTGPEGRWVQLKAGLSTAERWEAYRGVGVVLEDPAAFDLAPELKSVPGTPRRGRKRRAA